MRYRVKASRHSAFYSPLLRTVTLLRQEGHEASYGVLAPGERTHDLIREGLVDVMQSAVSTNWGLMARGVEPLPVHFAQINRRDGFFLAGREPDPAFHWKKLEGRTLVADHGAQPLAMLKYAVRHNGADWGRIHVVDAGTPEQMEAAFRAGQGDYVHLQAPVEAGQVLVSVGASMPPVAFSSLCSARKWLETEEFALFRRTFEKAKEWVRSAPPASVAEAEAEFFPGVPAEVLAGAVERYQKLGCWEGGLEIPREIYRQALEVFYPYEQFVV